MFTPLTMEMTTVVQFLSKLLVLFVAELDKTCDLPRFFFRAEISFFDLFPVQQRPSRLLQHAVTV
jgi:hypothetical protein